MSAPPLRPIQNPQSPVQRERGATFLDIKLMSVKLTTHLDAVRILTMVELYLHFPYACVVSANGVSSIATMGGERSCNVATQKCSSMANSGCTIANRANSSRRSSSKMLPEQDRPMCRASVTTVETKTS